MGERKVTRRNNSGEAAAERGGGARRYRGVPLDARRAQRREALVRAAVEVYGARGYRNATVKAICEAAGLTERYFYESFANGEALLVAAFRAVTEQTLADIERAGAGQPGTSSARMEAVLLAYFRLLKERPRGARVFLVEIVGIDVQVDAMVAWAVNSFGALFERTINPGMAIDDGAARTLLRAGVVGGVFQIALTWIGRGYDDDVDLVAAQALRLTDVLRQ
ncbi:TetR/AcrR family transcriptional regulator [Chelatococcus reniformis]|uniref:TetR family transcriptional regulator n=1 Tax=Chelatococcus reniformis TaxID=1494448 RepID=A0A916TZ47_9HYPH|nr:TetR/AcrR family transcriptional regulator [Chelatococcus reniformis]GGC53670.1 TetR family transcriptional regulator [Chelatococcus reniformis]